MSDEPKRVIDHPDVAAINETQWLHAKVRELEAEIAGYHKVMDELKADCKCDACLENRAIVAEERVKELEHRLEALESQHNLKGPKPGGGVWPRSSLLKLCAECTVDPVADIRPWRYANRGERCERCGRVL